MKDDYKQKDYVTVCVAANVGFVVELPIDTCREPVACEDPAVEAALSAISQYSNVYLWGEDKKPAIVFCDVAEEDMEIEEDGREELQD